MLSDNFITPTELRSIADACEKLTPLWELLTSGPFDSVGFDMENDAPHVICYDSNGASLGHISWGLDGPAFYAEVETATETTTVEKNPYDRASFKVTTPCPSCGNQTILGWYFQSENGEHQHTRYVCTFWATGHEEGHGDSGMCGWSGWTVG